MQNNFSKCREWVPRGTSQHKWRWLTTLLLILTLGIGQMWGAWSTADKPTSTLTCSASASTGITKSYNFHSDATNSDTIVFSAYDAYNASVTWGTKTSNDITNTSKSWNPIIYRAASGNASAGNSVYTGGGQMLTKFRPARKVRFLVTNCTGAMISGFVSSSYSLTLNAYLYSGGEMASTPAVSGSTITSTSIASTSISGLSAANTYVIEIAGGAENNNQHLAEVAFIYPHATSGGDTTPPTFVSSVPANSATGVAVSGNVVLTFSENIASVDATKFTFTNATIGTVTIDGTDAKKVNVGYTAANSANVTLAVAAEAVADAAGNKSEELSDISFTTIAAGPVDPTLTYNEGAYTIGGSALDLSSLIDEKQSSGAITYEVKTDGGTNASISGNNFTAEYAGTCVVTASQAEVSGTYNAKSVDFNVVVSAAAPAPTPCYSFTAPTDQTATFHKDDAITGSTGGSIVVYSEAMNGDNSKNGIAFDSNGLKLGGGSNDRIQITLNNLMQVGSVISISLTSGTGSSNPRGLYLKNESNSNVKDGNNQNVLFGWATTPETPEQETFTYTVRANDGLEGKNVFILQRQNTVWIRSMSVSNCGAELHALTSAIDPVHDPAYATVTLSKSLIAAGGTATATYSDIDAAYEFDEWVVSDATIDDAKANPVTITMGSSDATITLKLKAAPVKQTVTYYNGEAIEANKLGSEQVNQGGHATATGIVVPQKLGYTFGGWSLTNGNPSALALDVYEVMEDKDFYAIWNAVDCSGTGVKYSYEAKSSAAPTSELDYPATGNATADLADYATISGGYAIAGNNSSSKHVKIVTSTAGVKFSGSAGYMLASLDCALAEGDTIRFGKTNKIKLTFDLAKEKAVSIASGTGENKDYYVVPAVYAGEDSLYIWRDGNDIVLTSLKVIRPAKHTLAWNFDGGNTTSTTHTAAGQVIEGATIAYPADNTMSRDGYTFAGWSTDATVMPNTDLTITAQWTAWPTVTLNRGAAPSGDDENAGQFAPGAPVEVPACPFSYTDYNFNGWEYSPAVTMVDETHFTMPSENLTLTAQWVDANNVAQIGSTKYATLEAALADAANGTIELLQDIDVTAQVEIAAGVTATIDLAGHKIEYTGDATLPSGVILVHNGASLTINDSSDPDAGSIVSGDKAYAAVALTKAGDDAANPATLTVNGGTLSGYYYGITGNGSRHNTVTTINGGTIIGTCTGDNLGIYHPQNGTLTINGGTITAYSAAVEMRAGTLVINNGTLTATAPAFSCNPNGSGTTTVGAAIAIAQHTTKVDIAVTINGGEFNGVKAVNESNPQVNDPAPQVAMAITDGEFNGAVETVDVNNYISGGTFSNALADAQCATDYYPATKPNGKYGVTEAAVSVDFAEEAAKTEGQKAWATFLADNHYDYNLGSGGEISWDKANTYDTGLKLKKSTANALYFTTEPDKVITLTVGNIAGMTIQINGGEAQPIASGTDATNLGVSTYYSANAQTVVLKETSGNSGYNMLKSINIRDPYVVTFNANGGEDVASLNGTPSVMLPSASKGTDSFVGWFDALDNKIGEAGDEYTPTANIELVAHWEAISTDARLASIALNPNTGVLEPAFDPEVVNYTYTMPYGTAAIPQITGATAVSAKAKAPVIDAQATAWGETAVIRGVAESDDSKAYNITMVQGPKDGICIIKSTPTSGTEADVDGIYQGSAYFKGKAANKKLNSTYDYVAVELADGYTFQAGDKVVLNQAADLGDASDITKFYVFTEVPADGKTYVTVDNAAPVKGDNWFDMPADLVGASALYIGRIDAKCNPTVGYLAVYRPLPPVLNKVTVNGVEGKPNALKEVVFEVAASTSQSQLEAIAFDWISNNDAWTADPANAPVAANAWEFGVANTVTFTDKDGDQSVYTITVNKAIPASNVELATLTVDGNAITLVPGQAVYSYEYPYGTAEDPAPVVAATAEDANAEVGTITQAASKNGTATFTVTAEDGTTYRDYTINISVSRIPAVAIYDGSTMTNITTKTGSDPTGLSWSMGSNVAATGDNIAGTWQGKNYTHAVKGFKANANENNIVSFVVPENYMAKVRLVGSTNSSGSERKMFIAKEATNDASKAIENYVITSSTYDAQGFVTDFMLPGTYYLGSTDSYRLFEFSVQLYPIDYSRDVTEGKYGTICLPNGGVMVGASIYTLAYYGETSKKIFFDEVVDGTMEAGKPYLFLPNEGIDRIGVFYTDAANEPNKTVNGFVGYIGASEDPNDALQVPAGEGNYIVQNNQYREILTGATAYILSHRAYIHFAGINTSEPAKAPGARRIGISGAPQVVTGVDGLNVGDQPVKLIIDGQMYILRGEKMYDATGRLVK